MKPYHKYVGLDVHKERNEVAIAESGGEVRLYGSISNDLHALEKLVTRLKGENVVLHFVYEAGPCGFGIYRRLKQLEIDCLVVSPSLVPTFMIVGSLRLQDIVQYTVHWGFYNGPLPLIILTPVGFVIYLMSAVAETNRAPFDLPEAEQELIGGFLTEYSGLKFVMYYLAEYVNMITVSALAALLFFGGWYLWVVPPILAFFVKVVLFLFLYIWLRGTFPRLRYDMLMRLGWKVLLPLAIANVIVTGVILVAVQG